MPSRTVRAWLPDVPLVCRGGDVRQQHLDLTPRKGPRQRGDILGFCLGIGMPPKTPPNDVESKRDEDRGEEVYITIYF
jgi:hypothetical protein